jgi:chemotaxis protein MotB
VVPATARLLLLGLLSGCIRQPTHSTLETDYNELNQRLSQEISQQQVSVSRLQGVVKIAVNSELQFPAGGWEMRHEATQIIAKMVPVLAPLQSTVIVVTGYTDHAAIGSGLQQQTIESPSQLSL